MTSFLRDLCALHLYGPFAYLLYQDDPYGPAQTAIRAKKLVDTQNAVARRNAVMERNSIFESNAINTLAVNELKRSTATAIDRQDRKPREGRDL